MLYEDARHLIQSGDAIAVRTVHNLLGAMTKFFTRKPYTHIGLASWRGGRLYLAELNGGRNHLVPISQLTEFDVYHCPVARTNEDIEAAIDDALAVPIPYGFFALLVIGLLEWLNIDKHIKWNRVLVCSGWCVAVYEALGWADHSRIISPGKLVEDLVLRVAVTV